MRLIITFIIILGITAAIFYLSESIEIEEKERIKQEREAEAAVREAETAAREAEKVRTKQYRDSTITAVLNTPDIDSVDLSGFDLSELPRGFERLQQLKYLNLSFNNFKEFPEILAKLPNLETVNLSSNKIVQFTSLQYKSIKYLNLSYNQLSDFMFMSLLPNVETLNVSNNKFSGEIGFSSSSSNLKNLNISHNQIQNISGVFAFEKLERLDVSSNKLSDWSSVLPKTLKFLDLSKNSINDVRNIEQSIDFSNLKQLDLSDNEITTFYRDLPFQNIERLFLQDNYIDDFAVFSAYKNLKYLDLEGCQMGQNLVIISQDFEKLSYLNLRKNNIFALILNNNQLEELNISLNKIQRLHEIDIINAPNLRVLDISQTPFNEDLNIEYIRKFNQPKLEKIIATRSFIFYNTDFRNRFKAAINPKTEIIYE